MYRLEYALSNRPVGWSLALGASFILLVASALAQATNSDAGKERRWADQIIDGLLDGEPLWLSDGGGHEFLGVLTEGDASSDLAVILLHGSGAHPNWPDVIYPLREVLLEQHITSLSLQLPILANEAEPRDYAPLFEEVPGRIDAARRYLLDAGYREVALVGHSMGASMAASYLSRNENASVSTVILVGMGPGLTGTENLDALRKIRIPVFDIYGSDDLAPVLTSAARRADAGRQGAGGDYKSLEVDGANHFFQGHESELQRNVIEWLGQVTD